MLPAPGFHHLHLNSVDPDAAIAFYVEQFPTSAKASWGGFPALAAPNDVLVLFTTGRRRATDLAADRALAFRLACHRHPEEPRHLQASRRGSSSCRSTPRTRAARSSSAATPGRARAACPGARRRRSPRPRPTASSRLAAAGSGTCRVPTMRWSNMPATIRPSASTTCTCSRTIRSARRSGIRSTSTRRCSPGAPVRPG